MDINCMNNKIANANGVLQPTILQAILDLYLDGNQRMTANMVKERCSLINANISWNQRLPAICNSMRKAIQCGGIIVGEDRDFNGFTISFNIGNNITKTGVEIKPKGKDVKSIDKIKKNNLISKTLSVLSNTLNWDKLKSRETPKLLIIGCCDAKSMQPNNLNNGENVNYDFGNNIDALREQKLQFYQALPANNFEDKLRNGIPVNRDYFLNCLNENNRREALEVYGSNNSPFYKPQMKELYRNKIANSNLHLLIISGLYGIIRYNDFINDYHLTINIGPNIWGNSLSLAVQEYQLNNGITNDAVFYSLSNTYIPYLNPIVPEWNNLWINYGGTNGLNNNANSLRFFLERI